VAAEAEERGERIPVYKFLGFVCYWGKGRDGKWRLRYKSRADRFTGKLKGLRKYLKEKRHQETEKVVKQVKRVVVGWINYNAISDNQSRVESFIYQTERILFNCINRKGGKRKMSWIKFVALLRRTKYPRNFKTTSMFDVY